MIQKCRQSKREMVSQGHIPIDVKDYKGRAVGLYYAFYREEYVQVDEQKMDGTYCVFVREPGTTISVRTHKTKNGKEFGAVPPYKHVNTIDEAVAYVSKRALAVAVDTQRDNEKRAKRESQAPASQVEPCTGTVGSEESGYTQCGSTETKTRRLSYDEIVYCPNCGKYRSVTPVTEK